MRQGSVVLGLLLLGCAPALSSRTGAPGPQRIASTPQIPEAVGAFHLTETKHYSDPSAGTFYRYSDGSALAPDVFVYPLSEAARAGGDTPREQAQAESQLFPSVLEVDRRRGYFERFEVIADSAVSVSTGRDTWVGWHTAARVSRRGELLSDHQYMFAIGDQMLQVRITYVPGAAGDEAREQFIRALLVALTAPAA